jgi:hypothetical protein
MSECLKLKQSLGGPLYEPFMMGEGLYYTQAGSKLRGGGGRYRHLTTRDASILALACPMPSLVGHANLASFFMCYFMDFIYMR